MGSRAILLSAALLLGGCASVRNAWRPGDTGAKDVVATYADRTVTRADVMEHIRQLRPPARAYLSTPERKRGFVEHMILARLLYEEGQRLGYASDPAIGQQPAHLRESLVARKVMADYRTVSPVADAELRRYYDANAERYLRKGKPPRFAQVKEPLRIYLTNQRIDEQVRQRLETLKRQANLRIDDDALARLDPVAGLSPPPRPPAATGH